MPRSSWKHRNGGNGLRRLTLGKASKRKIFSLVKIFLFPIEFPIVVYRDETDDDRILNERMSARVPGKVFIRTQDEVRAYSRVY